VYNLDFIHMMCIIFTLSLSKHVFFKSIYVYIYMKIIYHHIASNLGGPVNKSMSTQWFLTKIFLKDFLQTRRMGPHSPCESAVGGLLLLRWPRRSVDGSDSDWRSHDSWQWFNNFVGAATTCNKCLSYSTISSTYQIMKLYFTYRSKVVETSSNPKWK